jgi:ActR/RegA family two-component response regulator
MSTEIEPLAEVINKHLVRALRATQWNISEAARLLGVNRRSIQRWLLKGTAGRKVRRHKRKRL